MPQPADRSYKHRATLASVSPLATDPKIEGDVVNGVIVISTGPARGHFAVQYKDGSLWNYRAGNPDHAKLQRYPIMIDTTTLKQVAECGNSRPSVKAKADHGDGVLRQFGKYTSFEVQGDDVKARLELFPDLEAAKVVRNILQHTPTECGNSIDYIYRYELDPSQKFALARCDKLSSVDLVDDPAATRSLLGELEEEPEPDTSMPLTPEEKKELVSEFGTELASQLKAAIEPITAKQAEQDKALADMSTKLGTIPDDEAIKKASLAAMDAAFPKAALQHFGAIQKANEDATSFEAEVDKIYAKMENKDRGKATLLAADMFPDLYNARMTAKPQDKGAA